MKNSSADDSSSKKPGTRSDSSEKSPLSSSLRPEEILLNLSRPRLFFREDRFTYTFLSDREAASIHFDAPRGEIFLNGHNLRNMKPSESHRGELKAVSERLKSERADSLLIRQYEACLLKFLS